MYAAWVNGCRFRGRPGLGGELGGEQAQVAGASEGLGDAYGGEKVWRWITHTHYEIARSRRKPTLKARSPGVA